MSKEKTQFKKGQSGNPSGRPKIDPLITAVKETSYKQFLEGLQKYGALSLKDMDLELKRPDATMFELMFGNIVASAAKGDKDARQVLLERLWGKVKDQVEYTNTSKMSTEELLKLSKEALRILEG